MQGGNGQSAAIIPTEWWSGCNRQCIDRCRDGPCVWDAVPGHCEPVAFMDYQLMPSCVGIATGCWSVLSVSPGALRPS